MKKKQSWLQKVDTWLCINLPLRLSFWWCRLWIREDEFHTSLDIDHRLYKLPKEQWTAYFKDLTRRRDIAHKRIFGHTLSSLPNV